MKKEKLFSKRTIILGAIVLIIIGAVVSRGLAGLNWKSVESFLHIPKFSQQATIPPQNTRIISEESVVIDAVDKASPSVVTVSMTKTNGTGTMFELNPFDPFAPFRQSPGTTSKPVEQDIGSGFIVSKDGLIVTNKHVVGDTEAKYRIITKDDKSYDVVKIYRDPVNDLAILKINATDLPEIVMGDSASIKVGQLAIAIGTALGEFRHTVTTGVISGMGRGITAGDPFVGEAERLDNVIQTDAAINLGNSGGPLLNSSGQVIGINVAVSSEGQNIGFALPINVVKDALANFNTTGQFDRAYLGVRYKIVTKDVAILNEVPEGAYIIEVVTGSPADKGGLKAEDIITKIDDVRLTGDNAELSKVISTKKVGETVKITVYRGNKEITVSVNLGNQADQ